MSPNICQPGPQSKHRRGRGGGSARYQRDETEGAQGRVPHLAEGRPPYPFGRTAVFAAWVEGLAMTISGSGASQRLAAAFTSSRLMVW
jgi:hypothetical protein